MSDIKTVQAPVANAPADALLNNDFEMPSLDTMCINESQLKHPIPYDETWMFSSSSISRRLLLEIFFHPEKMKNRMILGKVSKR